MLRAPHRSISQTPLRLRRSFVFHSRSSRVQVAMSAESEIIKTVTELNQKLFDSIAAGDYATYVTLNDPRITCFEPESEGHLVEGLDFHKHYFPPAEPAKGGFASSAPPAPKPKKTVTMAGPKCRVLAGGKSAVFTCVRLVQVDFNKVAASEETRVWEEQADGKWRCVHFHKKSL